MIHLLIPSPGMDGWGESKKYVRASVDRLCSHCELAASFQKNTLWGTGRHSWVDVDHCRDIEHC